MVDGRPPIRAKNLALADIAAMALACDQTRVFSNFMTSPVQNTLVFPGISEGHHRLTHDEPGDQPLVNQIVIQLITYVAEFLERLRAVPEGDGSLLDNCGILCTSDVSLGRLHAFDEFPLIVAGGACGRLRTGIHHRSVGANASEVPLTLMRAMGLPAASFGQEAGYTTRSVVELEA